jgi:DNA polymerase III subunit epsilon
MAEIDRQLAAHHVRDVAWTMEFIAVDVETANANLASICQIGIAHFVDNTIAHEWKSYVDPQDHFDAINVSIHGIDETVVAGAPIFSELMDTVRSSLEQHVVASHTAFDRAALNRAGAQCHGQPLSCTWLDTACVARRAWQQFSRSGYGLQNICAMIGYQFQHHDALEDAKAAGQVLIAAMSLTGLDLEGWLKRVRQPIDPTLEKRIARDGNPDGELYGEVLVFTGALTMSRREAASLAANMGCEVDPGVTKRTTILVVGDQDIQRLAGHEKSNKHRKAEELFQNGQSIRILRETDFCDLMKLSVSDHPHFG